MYSRILTHSAREFEQKRSVPLSIQSYVMYIIALSIVYRLSAVFAT